MATLTSLPRNKAEARTKRTYTLALNIGPVVVDVWEAAEPSGATPILLIHGWGGTGSYWEETARKLSATTRVIVPDLPGTGRSQPVKSSQDMFDQVKTLALILDELQLDRVQVVGHSMGSAMALLLAELKPDRIERVILTSLTFFRTLAQERIYKNVMRGFQVTIRFRPNWLASVPGVSNMMARSYFYRVPEDQAVLKRGLLDYLTLDAATAMACARNATDPRIKEAGMSLQAPTLLVVCREDKMMPLENVTYTADLIPNCEIRWIEQCGHLPMVEKHMEYMTIITDFLVL